MLCFVTYNLNTRYAHDPGSINAHENINMTMDGRSIFMKVLTKLSLLIFLITCSLSIDAAPKKVITLNSALTETVYALGLGNSVVATDVTSDSPAAAAKLPKVSKNRAISAEGLIRYRPDLVLALEGDVSRQVIQQLRAAGVKFVAIRQQYTAKGAFQFIQQVADAMGETQKGTQLVAQTEQALKQAVATVSKNAFDKTPRILFIYARGTGTMSVAGKGSHIDAIIEMAGGRNAVQEFSDFKPYGTEALVKANPDIILLFDFGLSSLGGKAALMKMPGVRLTNAGKEHRIIELNGPLLINFSNRLPEAILALNKEIKSVYP